MTEVEFIDDFAANLRNAMVEQGITANDLAKRARLNRSTVCRLMNGQCMPSLKALVNISTVLRCDIDELIYLFERID